MQELDATCEEVASFLAREPRDPFSHTLAQFPVQLRALKAPSFKASHLPPPRHIPDHLPAFPDAHTCAATCTQCTCPACLLHSHVSAMHYLPWPGSMHCPHVRLC